MTLVHNERIKLTANSLDRLSTACAAAGFIAPAASFANSTLTFQITWGTVISTSAWLSGALILHLGARHVLRRLKS
ncbi:hypothetical protein ACRQ1B_05070 [Rhizobium panacihumi]|uniref:hypothetical protein n=1 Tax=Rhizobium panacihumi TaxID=2008450 RepID=UPI003D7C076E